MSLDYPLYEEMKLRRSKAAKWWRIGDILHYVGLIGGLIWFLVAVGDIGLRTFEKGFFNQRLFQFIFLSSLTLLGFILVFFLGLFLKKISYNIAAKEGIGSNNH